MIGVTENLNVVRGQLHAALSAAGRDTKAVTLLAVSKRKPASAVRLLAEAGQRDFGENQLQEALVKQAELTDLDLTWHFIGSVQSNKTRAIAEHFDWVHAVDRLKIAQRLSDQRPAELGALNICLQVNIDDEGSKSGLPPDDLPALANACAALPGLRLRGLMCLPAIRDDELEQRAPFARLRELSEALNANGHTFDTLSMGMSGDYPAAIAEGATIVRIGTALFGARDARGTTV
ncbi:MAG: YggS family pyridoxal phosphate-dependent enzyme [Pseudomonadota bacterium]